MFGQESDQYIVVFVKTINGVVTVQGKKKLKVHSDHVNYKKKTYQIDTKMVSYRVKQKFIYVTDLDKGQLTFGGKDTVINSELIDLIVSQKVVSQLVAGLVSVGKVPWIWAIVFIAMGLGFGYIIGNVLPMHP